MITCEQAQHLFDAYLNGELSASFTTELDAHRLECDACRHRLTLLEACANVVHLDTSEPQVTDDFTDRLMAILDEDDSTGGRLQLRRGMIVAGGLLGIAAAITLFVVVFSSTGPDVAGQRVSIANPPSAVDSITGLPFDDFFRATDSIDSALELGNFGIDHLRDARELRPLPRSDFPIPAATHPNPKPDIIETLPELDDGGELM